jgi:hypothetical protein
MASFCPKCGSALPANEQFCKSCDSAAATPVAAPVKSGSSALKIILIVVAVIVVLGILVLAGGIFAVRHYITHNIHTGPDGQMTLQTPEGKVNLNSSETFTAAELGTDPYPGAQSTRGGIKMDLPGGSMVTGVFLTSDSKQQVIDFYKARLGIGAMFMETSDGAVISMNKSQQEAVVVTITANPSRDSGKARITITHTKGTKS